MLQFYYSGSQLYNAMQNFLIHFDMQNAGFIAGKLGHVALNVLSFSLISNEINDIVQKVK